MSGSVRAGAEAWSGAEAARPTDTMTLPAAGPRIAASMGASSSKPVYRRQGQPWGEPMRSKSSTYDACRKGVCEKEPETTQDSLVSGGEPQLHQPSTLPPVSGRSTADVATTTTTPTTKDSSTDTRGTEVSVQVHRPRSRKQRALSNRHAAALSLAASASRKDQSRERSLSRPAAAHSVGRTGGHVASDGGIHAHALPQTSKLPHTTSHPSGRRVSPRVPRQKSSTRGSRPRIAQTRTEHTTKEESARSNAAATAAAEAALDAAVSAAMEAADAAAVAAAKDTDASAATNAHAQPEEMASLVEYPRRSHTASSQMFAHRTDGSTPDAPKSQSLATMVGSAHEPHSANAHEGRCSHHHRSRSHRNSSSARRRRRYDTMLTFTGNGWDAAQLHSQLGGGSHAPCMVFVWPRAPSHVTAAAAQAAAGAVLQSKESPSDTSMTQAQTTARWLWQGLHLLAMVHLWPVEEGLELALMLTLPHLKRFLCPSRRQCSADGVAVLQEPQRRLPTEYAEESEGNERPDSPAIVAAAPCFPFITPPPGFRSARLRARRMNTETR